MIANPILPPSGGFSYAALHDPRGGFFYAMRYKPV
jgi:hypothetical protein